MRLAEKLDAAGIAFAEVSGRKARSEIRRRWRESFAPFADWRQFGRFEWEAFTNNAAPSLKKRHAIRRYEEARLGLATAFLALFEAQEAIELRAPPPDYPTLRALVGTRDVYVIAPDWGWSFVLTHEDGVLADGPYFVDATLA